MKQAGFFGKTYDATRKVWVCTGCRARVGTHPNSDRPLGTLANAEVRALRKRCHELIDPLWKWQGYPRGLVYAELARRLGLSSVHIGEADKELCLRILDKGKEVEQLADDDRDVYDWNP